MGKKDRSPLPDKPIKGLPSVKDGALEKRAKEIADQHDRPCAQGTCGHPEHKQGTVIQ